MDLGDEVVNDGEYFQSYGDLEVHRLMLGDHPRNEAYREAIIEQGSAFIKGKVVLDVGAGSGILSLFCMEAGAKKVYAVEASDLALTLKEIVQLNDPEKVIRVVHGMIEEVDIPEKVDVIVSEWMGFYLLHESMLDSVVFARDKYLKEDGMMLPSSAKIYVAACNFDSFWKERVHFWDNVYGYNMSPLASDTLKRRVGPEILLLQPQELISQPQILAEFNLKNATSQDLDYIHAKHFVSVHKTSEFRGLALWFECSFEGVSTKLSTCPESDPTHWKQTAVILTAAETVEEDDVIGWEVNMSRQRNEKGPKFVVERRYEIQVEILDPAQVEHPISCGCGKAKCTLIEALMLEPTTS